MASPLDGVTTYAALGPLEVARDDGTQVAPTGPLQRRLLAALLLRRGSVTSADRLAELVWGDAAPLVTVVTSQNSASASASSTASASPKWRFMARVSWWVMNRRPTGSR